MKLPNMVDISRWQGAVNWATIAAADVKAAGIRATVGDYYTDYRFLENWKGAKANGIARTAYHVVRPDKPYATQMQRFFAVLADDLGELPVTLDVEVRAGCSAKRINEAVQWCSDHVKARTDRRPLIYCVAKGTRILAEDLRWVPAEMLKVGDKIIGFDEETQRWGHGRFLRPATVEATGVHALPTYNIFLGSGEVLCATGEHKWLIKVSDGKRGKQTRWVRTDKIQNHLNHYNRTLPLYMPRYFRLHTLIESYESGFLSAAFDGEGCLAKNTNSHHRLDFVQKDNAMLKKVRGMLNLYNYNYRECVHKASGCIDIYLKGGKHEILKFLMRHRPPRLLAQLWDKWDRRNNIELTKAEDVEIIKAEYAGVKDVVTLSSSSNTYIAEGFGAHNTAKWFANGYCMDGGPAAWLTSHELWIASYPHNVPGYVPSLYKPLLPTGAKIEDVVVWQYTDKGIGIGVESKSLDYDWANANWLSKYLDPCIDGYPVNLTIIERDAIISIRSKLE